MKSLIINIINLFAIIHLTEYCQAQDWKRTSVWYFGDRAGLSVSAHPPTPLTDGQMGAIEGCATISDTNGNLLFYTNGVTVWNKNHQVMENGTGLKGDPSSTQSVIIIPQPGNDSVYFVFTTTDFGRSDGLQYSTVNINENGRLGKVLVKNTLLITPVCEKLTATRHANGKDYWVLAHGFGNDLFYAYLLTENGLVDCPVISKIGSVHRTDMSAYAQGAMKFSISGRVLGVSVYDINQQKTDIFDFNASNGKISNYRFIPWVNLGYGLEFSPRDIYIYISTRLNNVYQYNITSNIGDTIKATEYRLYSYNGPSPLQSYYTSFQLGIDNKIYVALVDSTFLGVINHPDSSGLACGFKEKGMDISPKVSKYGLPNFVTSYFYRASADFGYDLDCRSNTAVFTAYDTLGADRYQWNISKTSTETLTGHPLTYQFNDTGHYLVELLAIKGSDTARQNKQIFIHPVYSLDLGKDTVLCSGDHLLLDAGSGQHCYLWSDSSRGSTLIVDTSGIYHVKVVSNGFCTYFDSIRVSFIPEPSLNIDITRKGDTLFATAGFDRYVWQKDNIEVQDSTLDYMLMQKPGSYSVTASDSFNCFPVSSLAFAVDTLTGIDQIISGTISVYPNPVQMGNPLFINTSDIQIDNITIHDATGKTVWKDEQASETKIIYTKYLGGKGVYILNINQTYHYKIIVN